MGGSSNAGVYNPSSRAYMPTPPLTPATPAIASPLRTCTTASTTSTTQTQPDADADALDSLELPPPMAPSNFGLQPRVSISDAEKEVLGTQAERFAWRDDMTPEEVRERKGWLSAGRGRKGLRIVIVTENFLPKVDGVTRTLARLLEHLKNEGHQCMLLGPGSGMDSYAGHPLVGTLGVPLVVYPGLKLNFLRPRFLRTIKEFQPDVVHFVDPIWLGAQTLMAMELGWAGEQWVTADGPALGSGINGAVVASYHTNLATYATLFGMPRLEPLLWRFQRWLYSKTLITLCPSPSTKAMLHSNAFSKVNLWPRGVDLSQFSPSKRSTALRAEWGVGEAPKAPPVVYHLEPLDQESEQVKALGKGRLPTIEEFGVHFQGRKASLPLTPPMSPAVGPEGAHDAAQIDEAISLLPSLGGVDSEVRDGALPKRVVLLYVGRISWEKNIHLLLSAYSRLPTLLPKGSLPKMVFVGDGPARAELEGICAKEGYDAVFMGQRVGEDLARCFASADVFAFPSFTETFGQVVLEALASGLPVVGLDAEGTRDLVAPTGPSQTGLLLPLPEGSSTWPGALKNTGSPTFTEASEHYAKLLAGMVSDHALREKLGKTASTEGIQGFTWWDAMERCVDGYREAMVLADGGKSGGLGQKDDGVEDVGVEKKKQISTVNRVVSRTLAHRDAKRLDTRETIWHLKTLVKLLLMVGLVYIAYRRHLSSTSGHDKIVSIGA